MSGNDNSAFEGQEIGLFPLNTVMLPGGLIPLQIFEPRYLNLINDCINQNQVFGIVLIREGKEVKDIPFVYEVGTSMEILEWKELPSGMMHILCRGKNRFRVGDISSREDNLMTASVNYLTDPDIVEEVRSIEVFATLADKILKKMQGSDIIRFLEFDTSERLKVIYFLASVLPVSTMGRQKILEFEGIEEVVKILESAISESGTI